MSAQRRLVKHGRIGCVHHSVCGGIFVPSLKLFAIPFLLVVAGCATSVNFPVVGKLSNGEEAHGNVVIDLPTGIGKFDVSTLRGFACEGSYDARKNLHTITIPITCNNGQRGRVIATRDATGVAGTAVARLENGMTGKFLFGNIDAKLQSEFLKD